MARTSPSRSVGTIANHAAPSPSRPGQTSGHPRCRQPSACARRGGAHRGALRGRSRCCAREHPQRTAPFPVPVAALTPLTTSDPGYRTLRECELAAGRQLLAPAGEQSIDLLGSGGNPQPGLLSAAGPAHPVDPALHDPPVIWWISTLWRISRNTKNVFNARARDSRVPSRCGATSFRNTHPRRPVPAPTPHKRTHRSNRSKSVLPG